MRHKIKNWLYDHKPTKRQAELIEIAILSGLLLLMIIISLHLAMLELTK